MRGRQHAEALAIAVGFISMVGVIGCTVGPDYEPPALDAQVGDAWSFRVDEGGTTDIVAWWTQLNDPELTAFIERAFDGAFTLKGARERIVAARARRGIENADRLPTIDGAASYERAMTGDEGLVLGGAPPGSEVDIYSLGVVAGWELDLWGRVDRLVDAADAEIAFAIEDYRAVRIALAAEVAREVISVRSLKREIELVEATLGTDRENLDIARARERAGFADGLDVARAERLIETSAALLPSRRADLRDAEVRLAVLIGDRPANTSVTGEGLPRRDVVPAVGLPAELLLRRPDIRRAERALAAATARIGAADAQRYPRIVLSGSFALQGPEPADMFNPDAFILRAGPSIAVPLFEGGRIDAQVMEAESLQRQALLQLRQATIDAVAEVETAAMRRMRSEERVERLMMAEDAARLAESLSLDRYNAGAVDFLDVTEARTQRLTIERDRVKAERNALLRLIDLYAALGGGWGDTVDDGEVSADESGRIVMSSDS